ncbi:hypothetical protein LINPERHAP2_LOCUS24295 [Linum perenne]
MLHLRCYFKLGVRFLNLAESCHKGGRFFINIPSEENSEGWSSLLKILTNWVIESVPSPPMQGFPKLSYADMVAGPTLNFSGRCTLSGNKEIAVESEGVKERLRFLERCLCFRFIGKMDDKINWKIFRIWMNKNWGVPCHANISSLGDDLWLLDCGSKELMERILILDRSLFGSSRIFMDRWTVGAGRTTVLQKLDST